jgi:hypothetical protein
MEQRMNKREGEEMKEYRREEKWMRRFEGESEWEIVSEIAVFSSLS